MSSKSYKIIKAIRPPVMVVAGRHPVIKRILICSGGKRYIEDAVRLSGQLARGIGATVTLLHVMPDLPAIYSRLPRMEVTPELLLKSRSELGRNLHHEQKILTGMGVPAEVRLRDGPVLEEILREIREGDYDMVVTGSAPSRNFRTYILGDISREIVNRIHCAVLVVRSSRLLPHDLFGLRTILSRFGAP